MEDNLERRKDDRLWDDHNLLIEIKTQVCTLIEDVKELKTNVVGRVEQLEINKVSSSDLKALEVEVQSLQKWRYVIIGIGMAIFVITSLACYIYVSEQERQDEERANIINTINNFKDCTLK